MNPRAASITTFLTVWLISLSSKRIRSTRLGGIDWSRTEVYSEELNYFPSFWLNLRGREPGGIIDPADADRVLAALESDLRAMRDPVDGADVVARIYRRAELADGPFAGLLPDLLVELNDPDGCTYAGGSSRGGLETSAMRRLREQEMTGERGTNMAGSHSPMGICVAAGPDVTMATPGRPVTWA